MSTHKVEVVPVTLEAHPNADSLSIVRVWGFTCCVRTADFAGVETGAYIPPDSLVDPTRPEFLFLASKAKAYNDGEPRARIRVAKLRGVVSQGLMVVGRPGWSVGDDVADELGVTHYEPPIQMWGPKATTAAEQAPPGYYPTYDVENWRRYGEAMVVGEPVVVTEKIHGANARFVYVDDRMRCGSRTSWKKESDGSPWWMGLRANPEVGIWCIDNPGLVLYGEVYGKVQDLRYGATPDAPVRVMIFDILRGNEWVPADEARAMGPHLPWVPELHRGAYDPETVAEFAEGRSKVLGADHVREGCVVKPLTERTDLALGRVQLKIVGDGYMTRRS